MPTVLLDFALQLAPIQYKYIAPNRLGVGFYHGNDRSFVNLRDIRKAPMLDINCYPDQISLSAFIAPNATIVGNVTIADDCSILFGAVIRGDTAPIQIGTGSNIQDLCCLHADPGFPCVIGSGATLGHRAVVHGATLEDNILIGIGAIVLNGARIGQWSIIAAGALVSEGKQIPPRSLVMGVPGKVVRETTEADFEMIRHAANHYVRIGKEYRTKS